MQTLAGRISSAEGLSAADAVGWVIRLAKTLEPIHDLGVAHGAVSADAVQIQDASPSSVGHILTPRTLHDQPAYHSPERAGGEGTSPEDDTWAAAVTLYHVLTRRFPFPGDDDDAVEQLIRTTHPAPLRSFGIHDSGLQKILDDAFSRDILGRMTSMSAFREALEDWHFDPDVKQLSALWHEGSLLLALRPAPSRGHAGSAVKTGQVPVVQAFAPPPATPATRAPVPVIHEEEEEEEYEGPTRVRDTSQLLAQLAALKSSDPPSVRPVISNPPSTPVVSALPTPVVEAPSELLGNQSTPPLEGPDDPDADPDGEGPTQIAGILHFDRDSAPKIGVAGSNSNPAQDRYLEPNPDAPILPFDRESAPPRSARPVEPRSDIAASNPPVAESAPPQNTRTANSVPPDRGAPVIAAPAPPAPSGKPPVLLLAGLLVFAAAGATAFFLSRKPASGSGSGEVGATTAAMSAPPTTTGALAHSTHPTAAAPTAPTADATGTLAPTAIATATATAIEKPAQAATASVAPTATASVAPTATELASTGAAACMMPLFATGTFVSPPAAFDGICQITDPREAVKMVKMQVILSGAGRLVSDGMREWAIIGWYGMPAVAAMRAVCCPGASEMHITYNVPKCEVEAAMKRLLAAAINPKSEDTEIADALKDYSKTVGCTADSGAAGAFSQKGGIVEGELVTFQKTLARVRAAVKSK